MSPTAIGLVGALAGTLGALIGAFITHFLSARREREKHARDVEMEHQKWMREQKQVCYHNALKFLSRVRNVGVKAGKMEKIRLPEEAPNGWYDDMAEANAWLMSLHSYCGENQKSTVGENAAEFEILCAWLVGARYSESPYSLGLDKMLSDSGELNYSIFADTMTAIEINISGCALNEFRSANAA